MSMRYMRKPDSLKPKTEPYSTWTEARSTANTLRETLKAVASATYMMLDKLKSRGDADGKLTGKDAELGQRAVELSGAVDKISTSLSSIEHRIEEAELHYPKVVPEAATIQYSIFEDLNTLSQGFSVDIQMKLAVLANELDMAEYAELNTPA